MQAMADDTNSNVVLLPLSDHLTAEQALAAVAKRDLTSVLIVGIDEAGHLVILSSKMSRKDALWLAEQARDNALRG